ncbi:MAG: MFS transporter [Candidatus Bathyarchaeota archaeon]|nr:MFS transporter [Candidatus Bathyarchaeota archaeon]
MLKSKSTAKAFFIIICVMGLFAILSSTMSKNPVLKPFATSLHTPDSLLGIVASASTIPGILISLPAASLSDIFGRRKVLLFAALVFASAPFLYLEVDSWWMLALVRFYHGFATAIFMPVAEASIAELYPAKRGERISLFNSATAVGRALAPFLGGYILFATNQSFFTLYVAVGIAGVTAFIIALLFLAEKRGFNLQAAPEKATRKMFDGWLTIIKDTRILGVSFVQATQYFAFGSVEFFLVGYLTDVAGMNMFLVGIITGSQIIAMVIARPLIGRVSDKIGRTKPISFGIITSCFLVGLIPFTTHFVLLLVLTVGYGVSFAAVLSSTSPLICDLVPSTLVGASMGLLSTVMDVGQTLGPIVSGVIFASSFRYLGIFVSLSLLLVVSFFVFVTTRKKQVDSTSEKCCRSLSLSRRYSHPTDRTGPKKFEFSKIVCCIYKKRKYKKQLIVY